MAVEDLSTLNTELPEVFDDLVVPADWDDEWIVVPVEEPEASFEDSEPISARMTGDGALFLVPRRPDDA